MLLFFKFSIREHIDTTSHFSSEMELTHIIMLNRNVVIVTNSVTIATWTEYGALHRRTGFRIQRSIQSLR